MLKKIKIRNFYSVGAEQELNFQITKKDALDDSARLHVSGNYLNVASCIIGANASGKTTFLKVLNFFSWLVNESYETQKAGAFLPFDSHKMYKDEITFIQIEFYESEILYRYTLELEIGYIVKEKLEKKNQRFSKIFEISRNFDSKNKRIVTSLYSAIKLHANDEERLKSRLNVSFLSGLIGLSYIRDMTFFSKMITNIDYRGRTSTSFIDTFKISGELHDNLKSRDAVLEFSKSIDIGITNFEFPDLEVHENSDGTQKEIMMKCRHKTSKADFSLFLFEESSGTQASYKILSEVLPILQFGGVVVLDEIEEGLHPHVIKKIVGLFENTETNPYNAQIIFTTHQHMLINDRRKTQIFITEKNSESCETEVFRLDDVEGIRNDENYFQKYLAGVYGGTPNIKWL